MVEATDLASTTPQAVIATSATMASPTNTEDVPRKFPFSNLRIPDLGQAVTSMTPSQHTQNRLRSNAKLAVPHLLILLASLAYLITMCTLLSTGLQGFSGILDTQLQEVSYELRVQDSITWREDLLESRMDKLEHTQLDSRFMETYDDCLARGVRAADFQIMRYRGFQYPTFRNRTIDWTVENCGRLHHVPQAKQASVQQDVLNGWARISYRGRSLAEKAMIMVEQRVKPLQNWLFNATGAGFFKSAEPITPNIVEPPTCAMLSARLYMPEEFRLDGEASPCRLVYVHLTKTPKDKAMMDKEALTETKLKFQELLRIYHHISIVRRATKFVAAELMLLEIFCLILYVVSLFASEFDLNQSTSSHWVSTSVTALRTHRFTPQEQYAAIFIFAQINAALASEYMQHSLYLERLVAMIMCSMTMLLRSFISGTTVAVFPQMYRALKELYDIATQPDVLTIQAIVPMPRTQSDDNISKHTEFSHRPDEASVPLQEPTLSASSSHTELQTVVDQPHTQNLAEDPRNETGSPAQSETDSDSLSDNEGYVDLAGGISPTMSEDQEWAVVDA
ncbi:hypothetical protein HBI70_107860 [Parastagonospora nodorum]|nr:hypothetical protein HBI03_097740 [Parastagonospora nodorum]KAH4271058.1 hypothetical protein HBI04_150930 [Parastagonospora nodorum]KAH4811928.1 hypothetical protein HBH61_089300 [Parastagonospora nodorum]KAH4929419.1 hypothetical protein HBI79_120230 [Parastagonospora nodorum]KAH5056490.1 hypothetical protein HBH96_118610 [Parastagonospora nodorum]